MTETLTPEHFQPHLSKIFQVQNSHHRLTLTEVDIYPNSPDTGDQVSRAPFALIFQGPPADVLSEGLYVFQVEHGPAFELYVMPIHTPARERQDYQAAFN